MSRHQLLRGKKPLPHVSRAMCVMVTLAISSAQAQMTGVTSDPVMHACLGLDVGPVAGPPGHFLFEGVDIAYTTELLFSLKFHDGVADIIEHTGVSLTDLQQKFPAVVAAASPPQPSTCEREIGQWSATLSPTFPTATGTITVPFHLAKCTSLTVTCPSWKYPLRTCVQHQKFPISNGSVATTVILSAHLAGPAVTVAINTQSTKVDVSNPLATGLYGAIAALGNIFNARLAPSLTEAIKSGIDEIHTSFALQAPTTDKAVAYNPTLISTEFGELVKDGYLYPGKLDLTFTKKQTFRENTACFFMNQINSRFRH